ncbi:Hypothetical predicted protein [Lecanosticta acicola]|uniref:RING zinc finger-like domain-containing protein n=1 Tax=Lecanosticta acicola TaxID=111012 RepID=A0AAI8Z4J9_9PEZI|nr:Hypothetical predicted protein [Lecanosticta acicola]
MPPKANLTSSFSVSDLNNEVVCPLHNQDGSQCRKRCLGEKRYRSMQEHIRRAHPEYYLPKLPATKESFDLMISTPPHERPAQDPNHANHHHHNHHIQQHSDPSGLSPAFHIDPGLSSSFEGFHALGQHDGGYYTHGDTEAQAIYSNMQAQHQRSSDEYRRGSLIPAASAAAALAQLHYHRPDSEWGGDGIGQVIYPSHDMSPTDTEADLLQAFYANHEDMKMPQHFGSNVDPALEESSLLPDPNTFQSGLGQEQSGLLPSGMMRSPPDRPAPLQRSLSASRSVNRPRKSSLSQSARLGKHERKRSKELAKRSSGDRKAFSAEPGSAASIYGKRWEDLIDAAASATEEEGSRDLTPVSEAAPDTVIQFDDSSMLQIPASPYQSPKGNARTSLPPFAMGSQFQSFQASPLNRALTPPSAGAQGDLTLQHYPSVDSSLSSNPSHQHHNSMDSGSQFQIMNPSSIDSQSSPMFTPGAGGASNMGGTSGAIQIYCAGCRRLNMLTQSYACTQCICGLCGECTDALVQEQSRGRMTSCPRCHAMDSTFKPFNLDVR